MTTRAALVAAAGLLAPDVPQVAAHAVAAHDDPEAFLREHAERLDERGIDEPFPLLPWIALADALTDHGLLAEIDWKEAAGEITGGLRALRSAPPADELWAELARSELPPRYPLVLLPAPRADDLVRLAAAAGFAAEVYNAADVPETA